MVLGRRPDADDIFVFLWNPSEHAVLCSRTGPAWPTRVPMPPSTKPEGKWRISRIDATFELKYNKNKSKLSLAAGERRIEASLPYGTTMRMHVVGRKSPEDIPWSTVAAINLSTPSLNDNLGQSLRKP